MTDWQTTRAQEAAEWWADLLEAGDRAAFRACLAAAIEADLHAHGRAKLQVDYDPDGHLLDAVRAAGVGCRGVLFSAEGILPCKTRMTVHRERIVACSGYGSAWRVIAGDRGRAAAGRGRGVATPRTRNAPILV